MNEKSYILIRISLNYVPKGLIDINQALVLDNVLALNRRQAIIWTNMPTRFNDTYMRYLGDMS